MLQFWKDGAKNNSESANIGKNGQFLFHNLAKRIYILINLWGMKNMKNFLNTINGK